jgi:hypothetical protein
MTIVMGFYYYKLIKYFIAPPKKSNNERVEAEETCHFPTSTHHLRWKSKEIILIEGETFPFIFPLFLLLVTKCVNKQIEINSLFKR